MTYLIHITLDTADARRSFRDEVEAGVIDALRPLVADALSEQRKRVPIPGMAGYTFSMTADGRSAAVVTVWREKRGLVGPVLSFGIARDARSGAPLWQLLHEDQEWRGPVKTDPDNQPAAPWLGVRMEIAAGLLAREPQGPAELMALADLERCIAWAFLER